MPANVSDPRGHVRIEKRTGHAKGGAHWRETTPRQTRPVPIAAPPAVSWWLGLDREAFAVEVRARDPQWRGGTSRFGRVSIPGGS